MGAFCKHESSKMQYSDAKQFLFLYYNRKMKIPRKYSMFFHLHTSCNFIVYSEIENEVELGGRNQWIKVVCIKFPQFQWCRVCFLEELLMVDRIFFCYWNANANSIKIMEKRKQKKKNPTPNQPRWKLKPQY